MAARPPRPDEGPRTREDPTVPARPTPVRNAQLVDALDEEDMAATQRVAFEPGDLGLALDDIEAAFEQPAVTTRGGSAEPPVREPLPHLEDPALPAPRKTAPAPKAEPPPGSNAASAPGTVVPAPSQVPATRPTPFSPYATAAPPIVRHVSESVVQLGQAATQPAELASAPEAPAPAWVLPYVVVCAVLTLAGLGVLWLEYRTVGALLLH